MPVYVDKLRDWGWRLGKSCHMVADTDDELHAMARRIGLRREWFQDGRSGPHYDLTERRRLSAIRLGAIELSSREFISRLNLIKISRKVYFDS